MDRRVLITLPASGPVGSFERTTSSAPSGPPWRDGYKDFRVGCLFHTALMHVCDHADDTCYTIANSLRLRDRWGPDLATHGGQPPH